MSCQCDKCKLKRIDEVSKKPHSTPSMGLVSLREGLELDAYESYRSGDISLATLKSQLKGLDN